MLIDSNENPTGKGDENAASSSETGQDLHVLRDQVDAIDDQIIELVNKRIGLSRRIMKIKPASQLVDTGREQVILARYTEKLADVSTAAKTKRLVAGIIQASKFYPGS